MQQFKNYLNPISPITKYLNMPKQEQAGRGKEIAQTAAIEAVAAPIGLGLQTGFKYFPKKLIAKGMSVLSSVPEEKILKAIQNPNFLNKGWLAKEGKVVGDLYKKVISPMLDDKTKIIKTTSLKNVSEDLGLINKNAEWTRVYTSMKPSERVKILRWEKQLQKGKMSFNEVDSLIGEMDASLAPIYKSKDAGKVIDYSDNFKRTVNTLRKKVSETRKTQFPEAGKVLDRYENFKIGESVYRNFDRWMPHLMPSIVASAVLGASGVRSPQAYGAAILGAIPKVQGLAIQGASALGKTGTTIPRVAFEEYIRSK